MPDNEIYSFMKSNGLTDKDQATFLKDYSDPKKAQEIHNFFVENNLTDKDSASFYDTYFKKKSGPNPSQSSAIPLPSKGVDNNLVISDLGVANMMRQRPNPVTYVDAAQTNTHRKSVRPNSTIDIGTPATAEELGPRKIQAVKPIAADLSNEPNIEDAVNRQVTKMTSATPDYYKKRPEAIKALKADIENTYKNGDLVLAKNEKGESVLKRGTGLFESWYNAYNNAYNKDQENKYVTSLSDAERIRHWNLKASNPELYNQESDTAPSGVLGKVGEFLGENTNMIAKGTIGAMAGAEAASTGGSSIGSFLAIAHDMAASGYAERAESAYNKLKQENPGISDEEAYKKANALGLVGSGVSLGTGIALSGSLRSALGKAAEKVAPTVNGVLDGIQKSVSHAVSSSVKPIVSAGVGSLINDLAGNAMGVNTSASQMGSNVMDNTKSMALVHFGLWGMTEPSRIPSYIRPQIENMVSSLPREEVKSFYEQMEEKGGVPKGTTEMVLSKLDEFEKQKQVLKNTPLTETQKAAITGKLLLRNALVEENKAKEKHGEIFIDDVNKNEKKIASIDSDIKNVMNGDDPFSKEKDNLTGDVPGSKPEELREPDVTVGEMIDRPGIYKGERGVFVQDGQTVVFQEEGGKREYELGNIDEIKNRPIADFDIQHEQSVVTVGDNGEIIVRGERFLPRSNNPLSDIVRDENGHVVSVKMTNERGQRRVFRGNIAQDVAYNIIQRENAGKEKGVVNNETQIEQEEQNNPEQKPEQLNIVAQPTTEVNDTQSKDQIPSETQTTTETQIPTEAQTEKQAEQSLLGHKVGDIVNVTSADGTVLGEKAKVTAISPNGEFVQTDLGNAYMPVSQIEKVETEKPIEPEWKQNPVVSNEPIPIPKEIQTPILQRITNTIKNVLGISNSEVLTLVGDSWKEALNKALSGKNVNFQAWGGFEKKGYEETSEWKELIKNGIVKLNFDINSIAGKPVVVINPDNMLTGGIVTKDGKTIINGNGGINFVTKFGDVWASSNKEVANTLAKYINETRQKDIDAGGNGIIHIVVTKGDLSKSLTSHTGAKAAMSVLEHMVDKKLISISDFRKALTDVGKKYGIDFNGKLDAKSIHTDISNKFFGVKDSTFAKRGFFVQDIIDHLAENSKSAKDNIEKIRNLLNTEALPKSTERKSGKISFAKEGIIDAIGHLLSDNMTVGVKNSEAYATIEIKHPIEVVDLTNKEGGHESYPFHLQQIDENGNKVKPILNVIKNPQHVTDILNDANNNPVDKKGGAGKFGSNQIGMAKGIVKEASENNSVQLMTNNKGEVYGFEQGGKIYLNGEKMNGNTPIHETGHIWIDWAQKNRPDLHQAGMEKIEGSQYLQDVKENKSYQEQADKLPEEQREEFYKKEALAKAIGDNGEKFVQESKARDFKLWLKNMWDAVSQHFGIRGMTADEISNLSLDEFSKKIAADILGEHKEITTAPGNKSGVSHDSLIELADRLGLERPTRDNPRDTPEEMKKRGLALYKAGADVEKIKDDINNGKQPTADDISVVAAHLAELTRRSDNAMIQHGIDSDEYKSANKEVDKWIEVAKKMGSKAGDAFTALQGQIDLNTGSFTSVQKKLKSIIGHEPNEKQNKKIENLTNTVQKLEIELNEVDKKLIEETNNFLGTEETSKKFTEKAKKVADAFRKLKQKEFTFKDENGNDVPLQKMGGPVSWNELIELGAKAIEKSGEIADGVKAIIDNVKEADWYKNLSVKDKDRFATHLTEQYKDAIKSTPEQKNIARMERELERLQQGIIKTKNPSRELTERENKLKEQIQDEKEKLGLVPSKMKKPMTEDEIIENNIKSEEQKLNNLIEKNEKLAKQKQKDLQLLQEKYVDKKGDKFTPDEAKEIWNYARKTYLDNGIDYREMIKKVSDDLGMTWHQVSEAITTPKIKALSDEMWKKNSDLNKQKRATKEWIQNQGKNKFLLWLKKASGAFRSVAVFGHGGIFIGTHAGMTMFQPSKWKHTIPAFFKGWKYAYGNTAAYEREMEGLKNSDNYILAQRAGLKNNPDRAVGEEYQESQKYLGRLGGAGERGFNAIKVLRQGLFDTYYDRLSEEEKSDINPKTNAPFAAERIAQLVNNATGASNIKIPNAINEITFAGGMESARFAKLLRNPVEASVVAGNIVVDMVRKDKQVSASDKVFVKIWAKRVGEQLGVMAGLLVVNAAMQNKMNPNNKVNITDPTKSDFLKFKFGDVTLDMSSGMLGTLNFLIGLANIPRESKKELNNKSRLDSYGDRSVGYLRGKLAPAYSTVIDLATHVDYGKNVLPYYHDKPEKGHHRLSVKEYALEKAPLPVAEAASIAYESAKANGADEVTLKHIMKGVGLGIVSGGTGFRVSEHKSKHKK